MVPPSSDNVSRAPSYSFSLPRTFRIRGYHPLRPHFRERSTRFKAAYGLVPVRSPLLRESRLISFPQGTEMFHFPWFASCTYGFSTRYPGYPGWVSPFRDLRITVCLPTPRSFSQATTSFIASDCQGIHRMRLFT